MWIQRRLFQGILRSWIWGKNASNSTTTTYEILPKKSKYVSLHRSVASSPKILIRILRLTTTTPTCKTPTTPAIMVKPTLSPTPSTNAQMTSVIFVWILRPLQPLVPLIPLKLRGQENTLVLTQWQLPQVQARAFQHCVGIWQDNTVSSSTFQLLKHK